MRIGQIIDWLTRIWLRRCYRLDFLRASPDSPRGSNPGAIMYTGQYVFTQLTDHLPWHALRRCVARYDGDRQVKRFSCLDQFRSLAFAQLTWRESLRDIEV
jgi:Domain of unknown function (DUF4372)